MSMASGSSNQSGFGLFADNLPCSTQYEVYDNTAVYPEYVIIIRHSS